MRRLLSSLALVLAMAPASASAQQSLNLYLGGFVPRSEDARSRDDVLVNNLDFLDFYLKDFGAATIGGEWLVGLGDKFEGGLGIGISSRTVPTVYLDFTNADYSEIEQDLKLRVVPFTATFRFLPLGRRDGIEPYIGAGVGVFGFRYSESGQFMASDRTVYRDTFVGSGSATGPVILSGVRVPIGSGAIGGEIRYQSAEGALPEDEGFAGSTIDLGGISYLLTLKFTF